MADADRRWRRRIERVARRSTVVAAPGERDHPGYLTPAEAVTAGFLAQDQADDQYAAVGSVGGGLTQSPRGPPLRAAHPRSLRRGSGPQPWRLSAAVGRQGRARRSHREPRQRGRLRPWNHTHGQGTHSPTTASPSFSSAQPS